MTKKNVLSITKSIKDGYVSYTLFVDGRVLISSCSESYIVYCALDYYFKNDIFVLDETLSEVIYSVIGVCIDMLMALPFDE